MYIQITESVGLKQTSGDGLVQTPWSEQGQSQHIALYNVQYQILVQYANIVGQKITWFKLTCIQLK